MNTHGSAVQTSPCIAVSYSVVRCRTKNVLLSDTNRNIHKYIESGNLAHGLQYTSLSPFPPGTSFYLQYCEQRFTLAQSSEPQIKPQQRINLLSSIFSKLNQTWGINFQNSDAILRSHIQIKHHAFKIYSTLFSLRAQSSSFILSSIA